AAALLARLLLDPLGADRLPLLPFMLAVVAVAWHGGFLPSLLTVLLGALAAVFLFDSARPSPARSLGEQRLPLGRFLFLGVIIGVSSEVLRAARRRAEANAYEAIRQRHELEQEVARRKRLEEELQKRADQLAEADRHKDEFLAMLGHELRNPLAPIRNAVHI